MADIYSENSILVAASAKLWSIPIKIFAWDIFDKIFSLYFAVNFTFFCYVSPVCCHLAVVCLMKTAARCRNVTKKKGKINYDVGKKINIKRWLIRCFILVLTGLQRIELKSRETKFWRHQKDKPRTYLATIEAIYYFMCDYHEYVMPTVYQGEYDNLLFLFCFMYQKIRHLFDGGKHLKAYTKQT